MYLLSVFFPLLGGLINTSPVARFLGHRGSSIVAISCMLVAFFASVIIYYEVVFMGCAVSVDVAGSWFSVGTFGAGWTFNFDILTANMLFTVTGVSMAVHMYACDYMRQDPHLNLFLGYLSFFTGFMCVLVAADNLLVMLVGWEGKLFCPNNTNLCMLLCNRFQSDSSFTNILSNSQKAERLLLPVYLKNRMFFTARIPASKRCGLHTNLFKQVLVGLLLGDGWLERHGQGVRLGVSQIERYGDVMQWLLILLYGMGYTDRIQLGAPLLRKKVNALPYYQVRSFTFSSLSYNYYQWYKVDSTGVTVKGLPPQAYLEQYLTPLGLAIWIMGDGSGMRDGGFKISSHSFTQAQNELLCKLLWDKYKIYATVLNEQNKYSYIRVWKRSVPSLFSLVKPYLLPSCEYKFRHVKQS